MEEGWSKIYTSSNLSLMHLLAGRLEGEGIPTILLNKIDSVYVQIGEAELYVKNENVMKALRIIQQNSDLKNDQRSDN